MARPNQNTLDRIRTAFAALRTPYYRTAAILSRGRKSGHNPGRQIMPKSWIHEEEQRKTAAKIPLYWTDGRTTRSTELLNWCTVGLKSTSSISITSPRSTSFVKHLKKGKIAMKIRSSWEEQIPINKQDHCVNDPIINHEQMCLSAFNEIKAKEHLIHRCTCGQSKETHWIQLSNNI